MSTPPTPHGKAAEAMTVAQLIARLEEYPGTTPVLLFLDWERLEPLTDIAEQNDGTLLLGSDLPAEMYEMDYKYEC